MPVYVYRCKTCGTIKGVLQPIYERSPQYHCGRLMQRSYTDEHVSTSIWKPDWWEDIAEKPLWIQSKQQLFEECKKRGLVPYGIDRTVKPKRARFK